MDTTLVHLFRHNLWANQTLLDFAEGLEDALLDAPAEGAHGTARDTLVHLLAAEQRYLWMVTGRPPAVALREVDPFPGFEPLRAHALASGESFIEIASGDPHDVVLRGEYREERYAIPVSVVLLQVINHAHEHREQIKNSLSRQGVEVPALDGWSFGETLEGAQIV